MCSFPVLTNFVQSVGKERLSLINNRINEMFAFSNTMLFIPAFLGGLRGWEWIIILIVILLLFGGKKIPELMHGLGKGIRGFKDGLKDVSDEINSDDSGSQGAKSDKN